MAKLSNSPQETTILNLEARKSFAFSVRFVDPHGNPLHTSGSALTFTLGYHGTPDTGPEVLLVEHAVDGVVRLQAADLDLIPGTYQFDLTLRTNGYSLVVVKGDVKVRPNVESGSAGHSYADGDPSQALLVKMLAQNVIQVTADGGSYGVGDGLVATGVTSGFVPTALGDDTWEWRTLPEQDIDFVRDVTFTDTTEITWTATGDKASGYVIEPALSALIARVSYVDSEVQDAKDYADSGDDNTFAAAQQYADSGDGNTLTAAQQYADNKASATLSSANTYTDGVFARYSALGTDDLNSIVEPGIYLQGSNVNAAAASNYPPIALAGLLEVYAWSAASHVFQRYTTYAHATYPAMTWTRARSSGSWSDWRYIGPLALPDPTTEVGDSTNTITATSWANLPTNVAVAVTVPGALRMLVFVEFGGWMTAAAGADLRFSVVATGATSLGASQPNWGAVPWSSTTYDSGGQRGATRSLVLNAGTTTFTLRAYKSGVPTTTINYPYLTVTPVRWAQ